MGADMPHAQRKVCSPSLEERRAQGILTAVAPLPVGHHASLRFAPRPRLASIDEELGTGAAGTQAAIVRALSDEVERQLGRGDEAAIREQLAQERERLVLRTTRSRIQLLKVGER